MNDPYVYERPTLHVWMTNPFLGFDVNHVYILDMGII